MRLIDADAYAKEMKKRQDACEKWLHDAERLNLEEVINRGNSAFSVFIEAKLTLDKMPTVDAVPVVRCKDCVHRDPADKRCDCGGHEWVIGKVVPVKDDWFCADGEKRK